LKGGIYAEEKCPIRGLRMQNNGSSGLACPDHPKIMTRAFIVRFVRKVLYKYWKKACANPGIEGVDLYGGTRH
jgi:hypothetical protein